MVRSADGPEWTRETLTELARELARTHGESLTLAILRKESGLSRERIIKLCGAWSGLRQAIGLSPFGLHSQKTLTDEAMRERLRSVVAEHGENVSLAKFSKLSGYSSTLIMRRFGSWRELRQSVGLSARAKMANHYTDQEIFDDIFQVVCRIHRVPTFRRYKRDGGKISAQTMCDRFGSWENVLYAYEDEFDRRRGDSKPQFRRDPRNEKAFYVFEQGKPLYHIVYDSWEFKSGKKTPLPPDFQM